LKTVALVPARCGSKSIPLKNIKPLCGKPLLYWSLEALEHSKYVDKVYVATDCIIIKEIILAFPSSKVEVYDRLSENAQDTSSTEDLMLELINTLHLENSTNLLLLQTTTPFTTTLDIDSAIELYLKENSDSLLTCARTKKFIWTADGTPLNYNFKNRPRRQSFSGTLIENGALYLSSVKGIKESRCRLSGKISIYEMPEFTMNELDEPGDWPIVEELMKRHMLNNIACRGQIKLFLSDIDGVLTDAGMYYSEGGEELKKFSTYDGKAFELLRSRGIITGLITSENTKLNERRAFKIKIDHLFQGVPDKLKVAKGLCEQYGIDMAEVAFVGDDLGDLELLQQVGFAACPSNAMASIKEVRNIYHLSKKGGEGAVREFVDEIIGLKFLQKQVS